MSERKRENAAQAAKNKDQTKTKENQTKEGKVQQSNDNSGSMDSSVFDESAARSVVDKDLADFFASYFNDDKTTQLSTKPTSTTTTTVSIIRKLKVLRPGTLTPRAQPEKYPSTRLSRSRLSSLQSLRFLC